VFDAPVLDAPVLDAPVPALAPAPAVAPESLRADEHDATPSTKDKASVNCRHGTMRDLLAIAGRSFGARESVAPFTGVRMTVWRQYKRETFAQS